MLDKLAGVEERLQALDEELAHAGDDHQLVAELARERAELEPVVSAYREYLALSDELEQALDPEMARRYHGLKQGEVYTLDA